ncbi:MAG TPA: ATP-binding cassette domain-containing protein, partial [Methanomicrobiales archaeon]|nr:ATP-binding cassette domain-containing protein [Methanomicrobiales archaeon]
DTRERLDLLFHRLDLAERQNDPVSTYSFGMRRKLSIIETLAHRPPILLLDEPSIGLDYQARIALHDLLREEAGQGTAILFSTNDVHEVTGLAQRIVLLYRGRVLVSGEPSELIRSVEAGTRIDVRLPAPIPLSSLSTMSGIQGIRVEEGDKDAFHIVILGQTNGEGSGSQSLLAGVVQAVTSEGGRILGLDVSEPGLGDVFLKYVEEASDAA